MAANLPSFCGDDYLWLFDWLKMFGRVEPGSSCSFTPIRDGICILFLLGTRVIYDTHLLVFFFSQEQHRLHTPLTLTRSHHISLHDSP